MIYFLHGDNQVASRQKLSELIIEAKTNKQEIIQLNGLKIDLNQLIQALESSSLFGQDKLVIVENLFSRQKSKQKEDLINYLKKEKIDPDLIIWERKEIPGTTTRWLPQDWQYQVFKTPVVIFKFLDSIKPHNQQQSLTLLHQCIRVDSAEMVFYMLARRLHDLIIASDLGKAGLKGAPWQIGKLIHQAKNFTRYQEGTGQAIDQLIKIYRNLLKIDTDIKTGRALMPLDWHLDLLITNL